MKKDEVVTTLRISKDLHEQIRRIAKERRRSINAQIIHILAGWIIADQARGGNNG